MRNVRITSSMVKQLKKQQVKKDLVEKLRGMTDRQVAELIRPADQFNSSQEWRALRDSIVQKYGTVCMCCKQTPRHKRDVNVDHIKPRKYYPELAFDPENLQVLCSGCNKKKGNKSTTDYRPR